MREPVEHTESFPDDDFFAAGKHYRNIGQLFVKMSKDGYWGRDIYDREVFYAAELFPCFDCFDSMYDDRCYRWFFLREGNRLTRFFYADGSWEVHVTEDVENVENYCWEGMLEQDYFPTAEEEKDEH